VHIQHDATGPSLRIAPEQWCARTTQTRTAFALHPSAAFPRKYKAPTRWMVSNARMALRQVDGSIDDAVAFLSRVEPVPRSREACHLDAARALAFWRRPHELNDRAFTHGRR
jgi:hypothetical protein